MYKILSKEKLNKYIDKMTIEAPFVAKRCQPGQFVILRVDSDGERIPLTIADYNRDENSVTIIYQKVGYTTELLGMKKSGDFIEDFAGPLGKARNKSTSKRVLAIGGGVGVAPLYPQLKYLFPNDVYIDVVLGARDKDLLILKNEVKQIANNLYIATNNGSEGVKGYVTDIISNKVNISNYDEVIAIGPLMMMKAVVELVKPYGVPINVSLNPIMIDGTGMCGGCRVSINGETKFACVDGPDFDGYSVDFEKLLNRNSYYKKEEHDCRLLGRSLINEEQH